MNNNKNFWIILIICIVAGLIRFTFYIILIIVISKWNKFYISEKSYEIQGGDIIMRKILPFSIFKNFYHLGIVSNDKNFIYHQTINKFKKTTLKSFLKLEKNYYILHFPKGFYKEWNEEIEEKEFHIKDLLGEASILKDKINLKILSLRIKEKYVKNFFFNSIQLNNILCPFNYQNNQCNNEKFYYLTKHKFIK